MMSKGKRGHKDRVWFLVSRLYVLFCMFRAELDGCMCVWQSQCRVVMKRYGFDSVRLTTQHDETNQLFGHNNIALRP